jgi:hypothetical protein
MGYCTERQLYQIKQAVPNAVLIIIAFQIILALTVLTYILLGFCLSISGNPLILLTLGHIVFRFNISPQISDAQFVLTLGFVFALVFRYLEIIH